MGERPDRWAGLVQHAPEIPERLRADFEAANRRPAQPPRPASERIAEIEAEARVARGEKKRAPRRDIEGEEQERLALVLGCAGLLWCHVPNGGARSGREATELRRRGVRRGVVDLFVFTRPPAAPEACGVAIELKRPDLRRPLDPWHGATDEQREWLRALDTLGWVPCVFYGCDDAVQGLRAMGYALPGPAEMVAYLDGLLVDPPKGEGRFLDAQRAHWIDVMQHIGDGT